MKIILYLFYFVCLSNLILCANRSECFKDNKCYNPVTEKCLVLGDPNEVHYQKMKDDFNTNKNNGDPDIGNAFFEQIQCNFDYVKCRQKNSNDIEENCKDKFTGAENQTYKCCYMTLDFKHNKKHECYPVIFDKDEIKRVIDKLEEEYVDVKSVKIKCDNISYIKITYFLLFNILFLI